MIDGPNGVGDSVGLGVAVGLGVSVGVGAAVGLGVGDGVGVMSEGGSVEGGSVDGDWLGFALGLCWTAAGDCVKTIRQDRSVAAAHRYIGFTPD